MSESYTFNPFLVDAGMLFVGATPVGWGPTRGGLSFDPGQEMRDPPWDGRSSPVDGTLRVIKYESRITGKIADKTAAALGRLLPGMTSDGSSSNNIITPRDARSFISTSDTLSDVLLVHRGSNGVAEGVWFKKAIVETWKQEGPDNDEVTRDVSILALLPTTDDVNAAPFRIISPFNFDTFAFTGW